jgi:hypothetical protein
MTRAAILVPSGGSFRKYIVCTESIPFFGVPAPDILTFATALFDYITKNQFRSDLLFNATIPLHALTLEPKKSSPSGEISEGESEG